MARQIGYKRYDFDSDTPLITRDEQIQQYLDSKFASIDGVDESRVETVISNTIEKSLSDIDKDFCKVHHHIDCAKDSIEKTVIDYSDGGCHCHLATKEDVCNAVRAVNKHTDSKFEEIDFPLEFANLNEQIKNLQK